MPTITRFGLLPALLAGGLLAFGDSASAAEASFNRDIRPILAKNCFACHGLDADAREADLRLDDRSIATGTGAIEPGKPDQSELIARVESDDAETVMPPPDSGKSLSKAEIDLIKKWIDAGAKWSKHWAFVPPKQSELPEASEGWTVINPIDLFIQQKLKSPSSQAQQPSLSLF